MKLEHQILELECVSPIHIGSGETLKAFEYLYDRKAQQVYFLDESKWIKFLYNHNLIDKFAAYVEAISTTLKSGNQFRGKNLWEWLNGQKISDAEIKELSIRKAYAATNTIVVAKKETLNDINCHIALSNGVPYIPGSSIKGMFRLAILFAAIKKSPEKFRHYWEEIQNTLTWDLKRKNSECAKIIRKLENEILAKLDYSNAERLLNKKINVQVKDVLRGLMVSDATCAENFNTVILQKLDGHIKGGTKTLPLFRECIPAGIKFSFSVTIDLDMLKVIGISSIDEIIEMARNFTDYTLNLQKEFWGKNFPEEFAEAETADIFIGGGVGFLSKSLLYALAPEHEQARIFAAEYFDQTFQKFNRFKRITEPAHWHKRFSKKIAPRILKVTRTSSARQIFGMCKIRVVK